MSKNIYLFIFILFFSVGATSQIINIPDANFKTKLLQASTANSIAYDVLGHPMSIDSNSDSEIEVSEAVLVKELRIANSNISSLDGIENFTNLYYLDFSDNQIGQLNSSFFHGLFLLYCTNNHLTSLDLTNNLELSNLDCSHNLINQIVLPDFTYGITANIGFNELSSIDLSNLSKIVTLYLNNNHLSNVVFNNPNGYLYDGGIDLSNNPLVTLDMSQLHNAPVMSGEPYDSIAINNTLLTQIICPPIFVKYYFISDNPNLELISFKNELLENFVDNDFDTGITIQGNFNLSSICVDNLDGVSQTEQQFFEDYFSSSAITVSTTICTLGIKDNEYLSLFTLYPNPTTGIINIDVSHNQQIIKSTINNVLGQTIMTFQNVTMLDISSLTKGIYFVTVETDNGKDTLQIIKQ